MDIISCTVQHYEKVKWDIVLGFSLVAEISKCIHFLSLFPENIFLFSLNIFLC
jgi:hypothetical protein